jgi:glycerophosphoryl diester phosphodiesterase
MASKHPILPDHRPLAIAHRGGNDLGAAATALDLGVDMLEADVWPFHGRLEIRHSKTIGPLPVYWEKWYIESVGGRQLRLPELVQGTPPDARLFLDLKGQFPRLGQRVVTTIRRIQEEREIILCGRAWRQLDPIEQLPHVHVFYSVGDENQLAQVWPRLENQAHPAVSINYGLLTKEVVTRLNALGATIIAWTVNDPAFAKTLFELGVDGFTSDNLDMLARIARLREHAFDAEPAADLPEEPTRKGEE